MRTVVITALLAATSSGCALYNGIVGTCEGETFTSYVGQTIPDNNDSGITSTISVPLSGQPDGVGIVLNIEHDFESDLQIRVAHGASVIEIEELDDHGPFHQWDSFDVAGAWTINVADTASADVGYWTDWELVICGE